MIVLIIGSSVRFSKFREIGLYNKLLAWPQSYKLKLSIQILNVLLVIAQIVLLFVLSLSQKIMEREASLFLQVIVWVVSICMSRFEFRRAIGHIWYMHPLLWFYTTLYYVFVLCSNALNQNQIFSNQLPLFILLLCQVCSTLVLAVLSLVYPRDISLKRLNYVQFELEDDNLS